MKESFSAPASVGSDFAIRRITDARDLDTIAAWMQQWWGDREGYAPEAVRASMARGLNADRLPQTFGLYHRVRLIGMYQFTMEDLFVRPDLYPWLANVWIEPAYRGRGLGRLLLGTVPANARAAGLSELYLFTEHTGLYEKLGWTFLEPVDTFLEPRLQNLYRLTVEE